MLKETQLIRLFSPRNWQRGEALFKQDCVFDLHINPQQTIVTGVVSSELDDNEYEVSISEQGKGVFSSCSCPVGRLCKHAAALCQAVFAEQHTHVTATDQQIEQWLHRFKAPSNKPQKGLEVAIFVLSERVAASGRGLMVSVHLSKRLKSGEISQTAKALAISELDIRQRQFSVQDRHLVADVLASRDIYGQITDFELVSRLIDSGRCYWQRYPSSELQSGANLQANFAWHHDGRGVRLVTDLPSGWQLLATEPPAYLDPVSLQLGPLDFGMSDHQARSLLDLPVMDKEQLNWLLPQVRPLVGKALASPSMDAMEHDERRVPNAHLYLFSQAHQPKNAVMRVHFDYQGVLINPHDKSIRYTDAKGQLASRNSEAEQRILDEFIELGFKPYAFEKSVWDVLQNYQMRLPANRWFSVLHKQVPQWRERQWTVEFADNFYYELVNQDGDLAAEIEEQDDGFLIGMQVQVEGTKLSMLPLLKSTINALSNDGKDDAVPEFIYVKLDEQRALPLKSDVLMPLLNQFIELQLPNSLDKQGRLKLSALRGKQTLDVLQQEQVATRGEATLRQIANRMGGQGELPEVSAPKSLKATLRPYQLAGVQWMQYLRHFDLAGILADDMGLGKTLQALTHLLLEKQSQRSKLPSLIIAPTSVVYNWLHEAQKFTPELSVLLLSGSERQSQFERIADMDVVITSYALLQRDTDLYNSLSFYYLVMDEAQYLKNPSTKLYKQVAGLKAQHKLCLTGTPMENHLGEIWAQFNLVLPGLLGNQNQFTRLFRTPIEKHRDAERYRVLQDRVAPFILRRTKDRIAPELPAKTEIVQVVQLGEEQAKLYESVRASVDANLQDIIRRKGIAASHIDILDAMLKLRQVCCDPRLLSLPAAQKVMQSAKLELLSDMLPALVSEGRRILIFSQFTSMLKLIAELLNDLSIRHVSLTGATKRRQDVIQQFKQDSSIPVFLISLRAGGSGLNLTEADTVIHYDPWWNPAVESQATDRVHRIGQDKPVFVYKLLVEGSIEEKIQHLQRQKSGLADAILNEKTDFSAHQFTQDVVESLLTQLDADE